MTDVSMRLRFASASPFARKVRIAAALAGLEKQVALEPTETREPDEAFLADNPLGKIPVLVLADGSSLYDSRVIAEYFDHLAGGGVLIPVEPAARFAALRLQALCDGIMDAGVSAIYEVRMRPEGERSPGWIARQRGKIGRAVDALEAAGGPLGPVTIGEIALAAALGYLDFRFEGAWRAGHPRLVGWLDDFAARVPAFAATAPM